MTMHVHQITEKVIDIIGKGIGPKNKILKLNLRNLNLRNLCRMKPERDGKRIENEQKLVRCS